MITHIKYVPLNADDTYVLDYAAARKIRYVKNGQADKVPTVEDAATLCGKSIGEMFVKPGCDASPWEGSASSQFAMTFSAMLEAVKVPDAHVAKLMNMVPSNLYRWRNGESFPTLESLQKIADFWHVEVADLFLPPTEKLTRWSTVIEHQAAPLVAKAAAAQKNRKSPKLRQDAHEVDKKVSHRAWMMHNLRVAADKQGMNDELPGIMKAVKNCRVSVTKVEQEAKMLGLSIGDLFVKPGIITEWYHDTEVAYLPDNVRREMEARELKPFQLSAYTPNCQPSTLSNIACGKRMPTVPQVQSIADALKLEISDLFLPPE